MKLNLNSIKDRDTWENVNFKLPEFCIEGMREETSANPVWVHFGAGNIFRAFQASRWQQLLNSGAVKSGIVVAEGFDNEIIEKAYRPYDNLSVAVTLKSDGGCEKEVVASVGSAYIMDCDGMESLKDVFRKSSLQMVSFTITEKGYTVRESEDYNRAPSHAETYMGKIAALCYERYCAGELPVALVSMDNCSHNGDKLKAAVLSFAQHWTENGIVDGGFTDYLNSEKVSFPWTMIDKITPRPDENVKRILEIDGLESTEIIVTSMNSYTAPYVNAEETEYLIVEDDFPAGRPPLEQTGIIFTDRETVEKVEKMKVCTCLNPLHTALAVFGCVLGYEHIFEEMKDPELYSLINRLGYVEGLPVVVNPGIIEPEDFLRTVLEIRLPNPYMPDTPQRIATDTSQKLAIRFGETVKAYISRGLDLDSLVAVPLIFAGWLRYLQGVDDKGNEFELSSDPLLDELSVLINEKNGAERILSRNDIFGLDVTQTVLFDKIINYYNEMNEGPGSVRDTLRKYLI